MIIRWQPEIERWQHILELEIAEVTAGQQIPIALAQGNPHVET
jgi:hypothetical protein